MGTDSGMMHIHHCETEAVLLKEETKENVAGQMGLLLGPLAYEWAAGGIEWPLCSVLHKMGAILRCVHCRCKTHHLLLQCLPSPDPVTPHSLCSAGKCFLRLFFSSVF